VVKEHIYYYENGSLVSEEELKNIKNPNESNLYE
jgi:antitoxin component YwqK of YwqJK toxin-antitoxin module